MLGGSEGPGQELRGGQCQHERFPGRSSLVHRCILDLSPKVFLEPADIAGAHFRAASMDNE